MIPYWLKRRESFCCFLECKWVSRNTHGQFSVLSCACLHFDLEFSPLAPFLFSKNREQFRSYGFLRSSLHFGADWLAGSAVVVRTISGIMLGWRMVRWWMGKTSGMGLSLSLSLTLSFAAWLIIGEIVTDRRQASHAIQAITIYWISLLKAKIGERGGREERLPEKCHEWFHGSVELDLTSHEVYVPNSKQPWAFCHAMKMFNIVKNIDNPILVGSIVLYTWIFKR